MIIIYLIFSIFLFSVFFNNLLFQLYDRQKISNKLWNILKNNNISEYLCINNVVITYQKSRYGIDVLYPVDFSNKEISCFKNIIPIIPAGTNLISCGLTNKFLVQTHFCYQSLFNLYSYLRI